MRLSRRRFRGILLNMLSYPVTSSRFPQVSISLPRQGLAELVGPLRPVGFALSCLKAVLADSGELLFAVALR